MRGVLLIIVLTSVCILHARSDIPIQPDFDVQQMSGKWYPIIVTMDQDAPEIKEVITNIVLPPDNGELLIKATYFENQNCWNKELRLLPTEIPGKFTIQGRLSTVRIVEADYGSYCISHIAAEGYNVLYLYSREPQVSDAAKQKYMNHVTSMAFPEGNIHYLGKSGKLQPFQSIIPHLYSIMAVQMIQTANFHSSSNYFLL